MIWIYATKYWIKVNINKKKIKKSKQRSILKLPFFLIFFYDVFMNYFEIMDCCFDI